jgi:peptidyl-prolyl cis-trans isomerase C
MQTQSIKLALLSLAFLSHTLFAADNAVVTVNGKPIKQSLYDFIVKDANDRGQKVDDNIKEVIISKLISSELLYQEAIKIGLDKKPDYQIREELAKRELLVDAYLQDYVKTHPISEADTKAAYEKFKQELGDKEYKASHILLGSEAEAKDVIAQINKGGDFNKIAKEKSIDPGSKEKNGDLGWFSLGGMVKPFSDAVAKLSKGGMSKEPVQTQFGWHVIKLEDVRDMKAPAYDKVKDSLQKQLAKRQVEKMMLDLRSKATIVDNSKSKK